jgi:MFS family permease
MNDASSAAGEALPPLAVSPRSLRGLDWVNFFIANVQTGFGPFLAVYLTAQGWTQLDIGTVLSAGGLVALLSQLPGGAVVDAARDKRALGIVAVLAIALSALLLALVPSYPTVLFSELLHGIASAVLGPVIAAVSLGLVGHRGIAQRLARNAAFASVGNGIAAAVMGACGFYISNRAVFAVTAALGAPTVAALLKIRSGEIDPARTRGAMPQGSRVAPVSPARLLRRPGLLVFIGCIALFQLANTAMLPLMGGILTKRSSEWAIVLIAASLVLPQIVVAVLAPMVGRAAGTWGRKPLLIIGFSALPIRGILFAVFHSPYLLAATQLLDGISAAVFGVLTSLVIADLTRGTGRFNLAQGLLGVATGVGASLSTTLGGLATDHFGPAPAFLTLSAIALGAVILLTLAMPETRDSAKAPPRG